jgi:hypothetical protein
MPVARILHHLHLDHKPSLDSVTVAVLSIFLVMFYIVALMISVYGPMAFKIFP